MARHTPEISRSHYFSEILMLWVLEQVLVVLQFHELYKNMLLLEFSKKSMESVVT